MVTTLSFTPITRNSVDIVFDLINTPQFQQERAAFKNRPDDIHVIIESDGGDADAAYHIAKLLDVHFKGTIKYIVPRFAKSAATLLVCGGNKIVMGETSELGPLDPQIQQNDGSYISAKAVQSTLVLIKKYLSEGDKHGLELATILSSRLNPLVLGQYESTLEIAKEYQEELLHLRMFGQNEDVKEIVHKFATGYTHHSRVINYNEAKKIFGDDKVEVMKSDSDEWKAVWEVSKNNRTIADLIGVLQLINKLNPQTNR
ncbi:MAG TPA: ATP-dependent Clp protease proteolytic subunit [Bacteroidia bacterium]|nr:ATP-dependent Clp protease proteolytic subunit [Bacteroidia bacterium]